MQIDQDDKLAKLMIRAESLLGYPRVKTRRMRIQWDKLESSQSECALHAYHGKDFFKKKCETKAKYKLDQKRRNN